MAAGEPGRRGAQWLSIVPNSRVTREPMASDRGRWSPAPGGAPGQDSCPGGRNWRASHMREEAAASEIAKVLEWSRVMAAITCRMNINLHRGPQ